MWKQLSNEYGTFGSLHDYLQSVSRMPGERDILASRQQRLINLCDLEKTLPFRVSVIELDNGTRYRLDGQLSLWLNENGHVPDSHTISLDIYTGESLADARALYCLFDHTNSSRNAADVAGAWMKGSNSYRDATPKYMSLLSRGMARAGIGGYPSRKGARMPSPAECGKLARESRRDKEFGYAFIGFANDAMWLWKLPLIAAASLMWDRDEDVFYKFFNKIIDAKANTRAGKYCPAGQLFRSLVVNRIRGRKSEEIFFACNKCMEAFGDKRQVKQVRFTGPTNVNGGFTLGRVGVAAIA